MPLGWSPIRMEAIALASASGRRCRVRGVVAILSILDRERKRA